MDGTWNRIIWPLVKLTLLVIIYYVSSQIMGIEWKYSLLICILVTIGYPHVVALFIPNTIVMPPMDHQCFLSNDGQNVNYYNLAEWRGEAHDALEA